METLPTRPKSFWNRRNTIVTAGLLVVAIGIGTHLVRRGVVPAAASRAQPPAIPVSVAIAKRQDVPIYLSGLGTVQATFTVGIHSQVDGKLQDVLFKEGQHVKKGDVLAQIDPRLFQAALDQAKAKKAQDEAQIISLEKDLVRFQALSAKGFDTQQNLDQQTAKVAVGRALIAADQAAVDTAQTQLDYTSITAPTDGRMGVRMVDPGNVVRASDTGSIAILVQAQPAALLFTLPAHTLEDVRDAMSRGPVEVTAFDRDNKRALSEGTLQTIDNLIDQTTATYRLKASFPNQDEKLWPGQFVNARIQVDTRRNVVVVPNTAVQRGPNGLFAWIMNDKDVAEVRPIQVGPSVKGFTVITSGLKDGEHVITGGQYKLRKNSPVSVSTTPQAAGRDAS